MSCTFQEGYVGATASTTIYLSSTAYTSVTTLSSNYYPTREELMPKTWRWWHDFGYLWMAPPVIINGISQVVSGAINCIKNAMSLMQRRHRKRRAFIQALHQ